MTDEYGNACEKRIAALEEAMKCVKQASLDMLSGRADGPEDARWYREGFAELAQRADAALREERADAVIFEKRQSTCRRRQEKLA